MTSIALQHRRDPARLPSSGHPGSPSPWLVPLFWLSMFLLMTVRAKLNPDLDASVFSDKRALATTLGALIYWLTIRTLAARSDRTLAEMARAALIVAVPGTVLLLVARELFDFFVTPSEPESLARNIRWLMLWLGYYGAWVVGFVAVCLNRRATVGTTAVAAPRAAVAPASGAATDADWLIDTIADEFAAASHLDRSGLAARLRQSAGYERAIGEIGADESRANLRRQLALRLAARLDQKR